VLSKAMTTPSNTTRTATQNFLNVLTEDASHSGRSCLTAHLRCPI